MLYAAASGPRSQGLGGSTGGALGGSPGSAVSLGDRRLELQEANLLVPLQTFLKTHALGRPANVHSTFSAIASALWACLEQKALCSRVGLSAALH